MRVLRFLYSFEGRFTVGDLQMHLFVTCLSGLPMAALVGLLAWQFSSWMILGVGLVVIIIVQTVGQISATIRRLHDHNLSGWWLPAFLIVLLGSLLGASLTASPSEPAECDQHCLCRHRRGFMDCRDPSDHAHSWPTPDKPVRHGPVKASVGAWPNPDPVGQVPVMFNR
jgi:uncharacterized membrane protein YhaH (DUF805 family)